MKLNGKILAVAAALVVGSSVAVVGCAVSDDAQDEQGMEQAKAGNDQADSTQANPGVEKDWYRGYGYRGYRGWGYRGWGYRGWGYRGYGPRRYYYW
jgi:hypothetical protein